MITKNELQANKGEWSELYVLFKIFDEKAIAAAGPDLQALSHQQYKILKVLREEVPGHVFEYNLEKVNEVQIINHKGEVLKRINSGDLSTKTKRIFSAIKAANSSSFVLQEIQDLMRQYMISKVKASSTKKTDLLAVVPSNIGVGSTELGFSIKSHIGGAPTLVNSSGHTNFEYEVTGFKGDIDYINSIEGAYKVRKRLHTLKKAGADFRLVRISSPIFNSNLRLADTSFPSILSHMLIDYYSGEGSNWDVLSARAAENISLDISVNEVANILKTFLRATALGMVPSKAWDTKLSAYGGYIIVLNDGQIVCYHLFNDDEFREYLFSNTKLDTPSTSKFKFGDVYKKNGKLMLNLNMQIRFSK